MYAGKIHLTGTETGVGVRNAGHIGASAGDVVVGIDGQLSNSSHIAAATRTMINADNINNAGGSITAGAQLNIDATGLSGDGQLLSGGDVSITLTSDYTHTAAGELQADGDLSFMTTGNFTNQGNLLAGNELRLDAQNIQNAVNGEISGLHTYLNAADTLTNRGLIDGSNTFIHANTVNNIGTGSMFGDHLAIQANALANDAETVNGNTSAADMAARSRLDIGAANIVNQNNSLIFSAGDIAIGGELDANHRATASAGQTQAATLLNKGATIEALGSLSANVADLQNLNTGITTQIAALGTTAYDKFTPTGQGGIYNSGDYPLWQIGNFNMSWRYGSTYSLPFNFREYWRYVYTGSTSETQLVSSNPEKTAQILSGVNAVLNGNVTNSDSKIIAGGTLTQTGGSLNNLNTQGQTTTSYSGTAYYYDYDGNESCGDPGDGCYDISAAPYNPANSVTTFNLSTTAYEQNTAPAGTGVSVATYTPNALLGNSLFQVNPDPTGGYLIETNPRFANYRNWLSSDYMLSTLPLNTALTTKRLGDGFYEQRLIREQINKLTGQRFLAGYSDDEAQYQALMNGGITIAQSLQLIPGVTLTAAQVAQLTSDIVWLVEQELTLPDGSIAKALVPQVYVRLQPGDISNTGSLLAGQNIALNLNGDTINSGTLSARRVLSLDAKNIHNLSGSMQGQQVSLTANQDINNLGGKISALDTMMLKAGNNINIESTTHSAQNASGASSFSRTNIDRVAGLYITNPTGAGLLVADAGNDINLVAAELVNRVPTAAGNPNSGQTILNTGNNLNFNTVKIAEQNNSVRNAKNYIKHGSTTDIGSNIQTTGDITLLAGNDLNAKAATITSDSGALTGMAGNNINITAGEATSNMATARYKKKSGTFSSSKSTTRDTFNDSEVIGSNLSADKINLTAGAQAFRPEPVERQANTGAGSLSVIGSNVVATQDVNMNASGNIDIIADQATHDETHYKKVTKSGFTATSTSIGYGSSKLTNTNDSQQVMNVASAVGSVEGNVNITSGKTYIQTGSDVLTPQGDINVAAQQVNIVAATDTYASQQTMKYKQSGITLAITSPVISAIQTAQQMSRAAANTDNSRIKALAAGTTALAANNAKDAIIAGNTPQLDENGLQVLDANGNNTAENPANQVGGINVSLSIGTSKSSSKTVQTSTTAKSSHLTAGGDINISAVRPEPVEGQDTRAGDVNVIGSQIKAANDVTIKADDQINLQAAKNVDTLNSKNKNSSASVGVGVGTSGLAVTASASQGKGKTTGNGISWTETQIQSGNQEGETVTLESGTDTNIKGAQVTGNQVIANVDGNLNIESLQDTKQYKDKQKSAGISVSIPIGAGGYGGSISASSSKTTSNYASVNEQSGIMAGDGGVQANAKGNVDLKGAVIASTDKAIQNRKNSLTALTLKAVNLQNAAEYRAKGTSATVGYGFQAGLPQLSGAGVGSDNGNASSVTVSGISDGTVSITDNAKQQAMTGHDATTTVALLNRDVKVNENGEVVDSAGNATANTIAPIFDKEKVAREIQAQVRITQAFSQEAPRALNTFVQEKIKPYQDARKVVREAEALLAKANQSDDSQSDYKAELQDKINQAYETMTETQDDYDKWNENGEYRIASNIIIAAISGGESAVGSAVTKESLSWAADVMRQNMIEDSKKFPGLCVSETDCISNMSGESVGVNGDGVKAAGGRVILENWCADGRCTPAPEENKTKSGYLENPDGTVIFTPKDINGNVITVKQFIDLNPDMRSPLGGHQGGEGQMSLIGMQFNYAKNSFWDKLAESFSGTHDTFNSFIWYDELGNGKNLENTLIGNVGEVTNMTNVPLAVPFSLSVLLPPEVWHSIVTLIRER